MRKKRGRGAYTDEFRREAVRLIESNPGQLPQIARDLEVNPETLRIWCRRAQGQRDGPAVTPTRVLSLEEENRQLRQENKRLLEERDILKKAAAFFARDTR
jgi:transposase